MSELPSLNFFYTILLTTHHSNTTPVMLSSQLHAQLIIQSPSPLSLSLSLPPLSIRALLPTNIDALRLPFPHYRSEHFFPSITTVCPLGIFTVSLSPLSVCSCILNSSQNQHHFNFNFKELLTISIILSPLPLHDILPQYLRHVFSMRDSRCESGIFGE
jgi:hypothetical protein